MRLPPGTATVTALLSSATDAMWKATVAATGKDQLRLNEDVELRPSFGKGMGVFAMRCARTHTSVCSCAAFRVRVPLSVPHSAPHPVLTACVPRAYHMHAICSPEPGTPAPTPHTQHPLGRDIPVETVVARYSGQLYSMPEFEAALFEDTTSGDYAFGLPLAGISGRFSTLLGS